MKRFFAFIVLLSAGVMASAQTADEVITNYINALGGPEKIGSIQTLKMTGTLDAGGVTVVIDLTVSHKKGYRMDIDVPGMDRSFQIYTPDKGWSYMAFQGQTSVTELPEEQVKAAQSSLDAQGIIYDYKEKGYKATLEGKETLEGVECYKLKMESSTGKITTFLIDTKTYYKIKTISTGPTGAPNEVLYSNYKKTADGYVFAFSQTNASGTVEFSSIEVNQPVDETIFKG